VDHAFTGTSYLPQVWLALNNLVVDPHFRSKYSLDGFRKDTVCSIRRFMNDLLIDQLPVLKDLQRVIDEISLNCTPTFESYESGTLVIQQVRKKNVAYRSPTAVAWFKMVCFCGAVLSRC
jgi:hypothetical protein